MKTRETHNIEHNIQKENQIDTQHGAQYTEIKSERHTTLSTTHRKKRTKPKFKS